MEQVVTTLKVFYAERRASLPGIILPAVIGMLFISGLTLALVSTHPAAGEITRNFLIQAGFWINVGLVGFIIALLLAVVFWNFGKGVEIDFTVSQNITRMIGPGRWTEPTIEPDLLVCRRPGESDQDFDIRMNKTLEDIDTGTWVVVIPFQRPAGAIHETAIRAIPFARNSPPFQSEEWTEDQIICPRNQFFQYETPVEYQRYVSRFCEFYREWSGLVKVLKEEHDPGGIFRKSIRPLANLLIPFFLCISVSIFAQTKSEQVVQMFGGKIGVPDAGDKIVFQMESGHDLKREGDGRKNYIDLLKSVPGYMDDGGKVLAVWNGMNCMARAERVERVNAPPATKNEQMRKASIPETMDAPLSTNFSMPDSLAMVDAAQRFEFEVWKAKQAAEKAAKPWYDTLMTIFWWLYPALVLFGGLSYFVAYVASKQAMAWLYRPAQNTFAVIILIAGAAVLCHLLVFAISLKLHPLALTVIAVIEVGAVVYVAHKLIPDYNPSFGNVRGDFRDSGAPRLNTGGR